MDAWNNNTHTYKAQSQPNKTDFYQQVLKTNSTLHET
jgi:hypothetical protein